LLGKLGEEFCGILRFPGVGVIFGTTVMARRTWPAGPRRARDSRHGGRPRCWGGTRGCWPECGRCRRDSRHARRG
jgi:hypothetical protein